jgi:hypothetical protein
MIDTPFLRQRGYATLVYLSTRQAPGVATECHAQPETTAEGLIRVMNMALRNANTARIGAIRRAV